MQTQPDSKLKTLPDFYTDKDIAGKLRMSRSWVRAQRHYRSKGLPHIFKVEPRYIGTSPRYVREEVDAFMDSIKG